MLVILNLFLVSRLLQLLEYGSMLKHILGWMVRFPSKENIYYGFFTTTKTNLSISDVPLPLDIVSTLVFFAIIARLVRFCLLSYLRYFLYEIILKRTPMLIVEHSCCSYQQLNLAERFDGWQRLIPSIILDTTRFSIEEPSPHQATYPPMTKSQLKQYRAGHYVQKYGACWKYEIGIHVSRSRILWARGPFRGAENDKTIFNSMLLRLLQPEERVLCDRGYIGAPQVVTLRQGNNHTADEAVLNFHRQKVENLYSRFKDFGICSTRFQGRMADHKKLILVLCQLLNIAFLEDPLRDDELGPPASLFHNS
jgi:hypothetical protein